jgi:polyphosphate:AMP phosphotransferase
VLKAAASGSSISKKEFNEIEPDLRMDLVNAQYELKERDFPLIIAIAGDDRAGANELVNRLNEWMDSRLIATHVFSKDTEEEANHPPLWRLWRALPPKGEGSLLVGGLMRPVVRRLRGEISDGELTSWVNHLRSAQDQWADDGALILKFFLHTPSKVQRKRMKKAKGSVEAWRYDEADWEVLEDLDGGLPLVEQVLRDTATPHAPWTIVEGTDDRYRDITVASAIRDALRARLDTEPGQDPGLGRSTFGDAGSPTSRATVLDRVDLDASLERAEYKKELKRLQARLHRLAEVARVKGVSTVLAFEGWDAGGKGGAIRRLTGALEAGDYRVIPVAAPTEEERRYHYMWRFWRDLPRDGRITIFDRTWYGRVLVERVEGFAQPAEWQRAYQEIVDFEQQLAEHGAYVAKFWLHISPEEQLARFKAREQTGYKKHKITEEDYRNREKWDDYVEAVDQMVVRTSAEFAPWHVISANDKYNARIEVLRHVTEGLKAAVKRA